MKTNCFKDFLKYSFLNILGMVGISFYILADTYFISKGVGVNGLSALNLAIPVFNFINGCGLMIGIGGGTLYSLCKKEKDQQETNKIFTNSLYLAFIFSLLFLILGMFFSSEIVFLLKADEEIFSLTKTYIQTIMIFAFAFIINNVLLSYIRNDGSPQLSMVAMLVGSFSNIILDYIFIFPLKMGIFGAVIATCIAPLISIAILTLHFFRKKSNFKLNKCQMNKKIVLNTLTTGIPSLLSELSSGIVMIIFNILVFNLKGNIGIASYGIIANISIVVVAIYNGIAQGIQPLFSKYFKNENNKNLKNILKYALTLMIVLSIIIYLFVFFNSALITSLFNSENNILLNNIANKGLKIYFIVCPFIGFNIIISIFFSSIGKPLFAHIISFLRGFLIIIPLVIFLANYLKMDGIFLSLPICEFIVSILGIVFYIKQKKTYETISELGSVK